MGKDRDGTFHPGKGKPSGVNKDEGLGFQSTPEDEMKEYNELTEKYTEGPDEPADNVPLRHANRNTSKGEESFKDKIPNPERDKTLKEKTTEPEALFTPIEELPGMVTKELFRDLGNYQNEQCVTIYMDSHSSGMEVNEGYDLIQFKRSLQNAHDALSRRGTEITVIERMLQPGYELLKNEKLWLNMKNGFAVFIAPGYFKYMRLDIRPGNQVVAEDTFYVTPLLPSIWQESIYYVLSVSKKTAALYQGNSRELQKIEVENMPSGIMEEISDLGVSTVHRAGASGDRTQSDFHGYGDGTRNDKVYLEQYLHKVDNAIWDQVLKTQNVPLVLVGVEYVVSAFKNLSQYKNIWEASVTGNYDYKKENELFELVWEVIHPYYKTDEVKLLEDYGNYLAQGHASSNFDEVVAGAYYSRVSHLFVKKDTQVWGTFDEMENKVRRMNQEDENAQDLIDNAVVKALLQGADVFVLEEEKMPNGADLAAIFRY